MGSSYGSPAVGRLMRRPEFLAVAGARRKWVAPGFILQARAHDGRFHPKQSDVVIRVGLTASRKVGGAVVRNRARRRLRALATEVLLKVALPGYDFVFIAREATVVRPWAEMVRDLETGLRRLGMAQKPLGSPAGAAGTS